MRRGQLIASVHYHPPFTSGVRGDNVSYLVHGSITSVVFFLFLLAPWNRLGQTWSGLELLLSSAHCNAGGLSMRIRNLCCRLSQPGFETGFAESCVIAGN